MASETLFRLGPFKRRLIQKSSCCGHRKIFGQRFVFPVLCRRCDVFQCQVIPEDGTCRDLGNHQEACHERMNGTHEIGTYECYGCCVEAKQHLTLCIQPNGVQPFNLIQQLQHFSLTTNIDRSKIVLVFSKTVLVLEHCCRSSTSRSIACG